MAGSIGFVGLVVPHVMRFFFGPLHRTLLIASALAGAILMVLADIASRLLIAPQKSARWGSNRPGWGAFLCRDYLPLKE